MATSEHMIMQNEALVALGLIAGLDLGKSENRSIHIQNSEFSKTEMLILSVLILNDLLNEKERKALIQTVCRQLKTV